MSKMWSTTVYEPLEGGHRYVAPSEGDACAACGESWNDQHRLAERYVPDAIENRAGLYCVEASDDNGRSYAANSLRWADVGDAKLWASGLAMRWFGCTHIRVRACDENGEPAGDTVHQTL